MNEEVLTDPSIDDMRGMLAPENPADRATPAAEESAEADTEAITEPASEPEATPGKTGEAARDDKGKFVAKKEDAPKEGAPVDGVQKRIDKAVKAQREAERQRDELQAKLAQQPGSQPAKETAQPGTAEKTPAAPKLEDFATYEEFTTALARHVSQQEIAAEVTRRTQAAAKQQQETAAAKRAEDFSTAEEAARKTIPDYDEGTSAFFEKVPNSQAGRDIAAYILSVQNPALMHALGKDPAELQRIAQSPNREVLTRELARYEAKLTPSSQARTPAKPLPKPPANVGGGSSAKVVDINDPDLPIETFNRLLRNGLRGD
jgi:chemotaxis protein histidine kinase CheA